MANKARTVFARVRSLSGKMKELNPAYIEQVNRLINNSPYFQLLSMKLVDVGPGFSLLEIDLDRKHLQPFGFVHGGVFASIIDAACFWAVFHGIEDPNASATTVDLKLNYLAPAASGKLIAKGRQIKLGRTLGYAEASVTDDAGKILAHGTSTLMILSDRPLAIDSPLPPKFRE
jgi:uncharacterized protein (TIGR00369 family)